MSASFSALRELWAKAALERSSKAGPLLLATSSFQSCGRAGTMRSRWYESPARGALPRKLLGENRPTSGYHL
ncbi:unnamed protein product [Symbiodinium natans]|uniref:Uncharacterized protein n=1 Tax=Symbiodinium natans TaxID=878477 RepID=A0A812I9A5_9DINO|nr:unnamed protein product [Symbiodinium natans]